MQEGPRRQLPAALVRNLPAMDPTVMAATIGVSGTVLVGVAGFGAAIWNMRQTIAHDRENRVWDRRAEVHVEALAAVNYRQARRNQQTQARPPDEGGQRALAALAAHREFDWHGLVARLQAFAAEPVVTAVQNSSTASERARHSRLPGMAGSGWQQPDQGGRRRGTGSRRDSRR
jgi:hypothetical protein